jgi:hypothetical protein
MKIKSSADDLVHEAENALIDAARWPLSEAAADEARKQIKLLRDAFDDAHFSSVMRNALILRIVANLFSGAQYRTGTTQAGVAIAWLMMAQLINPQLAKHDKGTTAEEKAAREINAKVVE